MVFLRYFIRLLGFVIFINLCSINSGIAQNSSVAFWPENDLWYKINPSWRLSMITKYYSNNGQLKIYWQGDYQWGHTKHTIYRRLMDESREVKVKAWMVRGGFMEGWSVGKYAGSYSEDQVFAEINNKIPLQRSLMVSHRLRFEFRWLGEDPDFSYRIRYRVMLDKSLKAGKSSIVPFVNAEPYWDSRVSKVNRFRAITGATFSRGSRFAYEFNFTYQWDDNSSTTNTYALGIKLHVYFETKHAKPKTDVKN